MRFVKKFFSYPPLCKIGAIYSRFLTERSEVIDHKNINIRPQKKLYVCTIPDFFYKIRQFWRERARERERESERERERERERVCVCHRPTIRCDLDRKLL